MNNAKRRRAAKQAAKAARTGRAHGTPLPTDIGNVHRLINLWKRGNRAARRAV